MGKYNLVTSENLPQLAAEVMYYAITPQLLTHAIKEAKISYLFDTQSMKVLTIAQPAYRYYKLNQRPAWNPPQLTDDNKMKVLENILNEAGGQGPQSLKWYFLQQLYYDLLDHGDRNFLIKINERGSEDTKNAFAGCSLTISDMMCEIGVAVMRLNDPTLTFPNQSKSANDYIFEITEALKLKITSASADFQVDRGSVTYSGK